MNVKEIRRINLRALARTVGGVTHLADKLGKSQSQISHLIGTNPVKNIGDRLAAEIETAFSKPSGWMDHEHRGVQEENGVYYIGERQTHNEVPLLDWQDVLAWVDPHSTPLSKTPQQYISTHLAVSHHSFALRIDGDSMESPTGVSFPQRSIIVVDPEERAYNGSFVVARQNSDQQVVFKQLIIDGGRRYLKPLNLRYPLMELAPQSMVYGVVRLMLMEFPSTHK